MNWRKRPDNSSRGYQPRAAGTGGSVGRGAGKPGTIAQFHHFSRAYSLGRPPHLLILASASIQAPDPMLTKRIIPCLDVNDGRVVKGTKFLQFRDAGDPVECAVAYNDQGADELVFLDITASTKSARRWWTWSRGPPNAASCPSPSAVASAPSKTCARCSGRRGQSQREHRRRFNPGWWTKPRGLWLPVPRRRDRCQAQ